MGWRWVFLMVVPPTVAAAVAAPVVLPEARAEGVSGPPDLVGGLLAPAGVMLLVYAMTRLEEPGRGAGAAAVSGAAGRGYGAAFLAAAVVSGLGALGARQLRGRMPG